MFGSVVTFCSASVFGYASQGCRVAGLPKRLLLLGHGLLFAVCCVLFVGCCLFVVFCLLFVVAVVGCCWLLVVGGWLSVLLLVACCLLCAVCC